jgi:hypothetical protein
MKSITPTTCENIRTVNVHSDKGAAVIVNGVDKTWQN